MPARLGLPTQSTFRLRIATFWLRPVIGWILCLLPGPMVLATEPVDFGRDIRPILTGRCFRCHGPDEARNEAGLRLDTFRMATAKLEGGTTAIIPGTPDESELIRRVASPDSEIRMPPPDAGDPLSLADISLLKRWIASGASYQRHWSFLPAKRPRIPHRSGMSHDATQIDAFVQSRLKAEGLTPSPEADRFTLVRRLSIDLTGLPPTIEEVDRFTDDRRPDAYERLVDRLLNSPRFGERWARVWLDVARYADSAGYAQDPPRTIWKYRDWVINAINTNMPFHEFTIEQLAGDLLPEPTDDQLVATAFHRNTMTNSEGGTDDEEFRVAAVVDRVNTTMQVWMGLTFGCAQCHNHKYDPISQEDYYRFYAVFNNTEDADRGDERPLLESWSDEQRQQRGHLTSKIAKLESTIADQQKQSKTKDSDKLTELKKQLAQIKPVTTPILRELPQTKSRATHVLIRGSFLTPGHRVTPELPSQFRASASGRPPDRLTVAKWLTNSRNPLTARVAVNRIWEQLFGMGLVETVEDFGLQGSLPSHPHLLDYLATEFVRSGWDTKALVRSIVTSHSYRQDSHVSEDLSSRDPRNRRLARGPRFRLSAEMIRDQALCVAGLLSDKMHGPSVRPPRPKLGLRAAFGGPTDWEPSQGEDRYRRALYTSWRRTTPYPSMATFDAPSREFCSVRRIRTNTPLQALVTLNDPVYVEAARNLAARIRSDDGSTVEAQLTHGFRLCVARYPTEAELDRLRALYNNAARRYEEHVELAIQLAADASAKEPDSADSRQAAAESAAWVLVCNVLMNLDEFLARK